MSLRADYYERLSLFKVERRASPLLSTKLAPETALTPFVLFRASCCEIAGGFLRYCLARVAAAAALDLREAVTRAILRLERLSLDAFVGLKQWLTV